MGVDFAKRFRKQVLAHLQAFDEDAEALAPDGHDQVHLVSIIRLFLMILTDLIDFRFYLNDSEHSI